MATNDELHRRRTNAVRRGVSNLLAVYADHPITISNALIDEGLQIVDDCLHELTAGQRSAVAAAG